MPEPIGDIPIQISGDTSQLEKDLQDATRLAAEAGKKISDALAAGTLGSDQLDTSIKELLTSGLSLNQAMIQIAAGLKGVEAASNEAAGAIGDKLPQALGEAGDAAKKAQDNFAAFASGVKDFIKNPLDSASNAAESFLLSLGPIGAVAAASAAAIGLLGKEILDLVLSEGAAAEKLSNMADRLNLSVTETQHLSEMAQVAGVNLGVLQRASARLAVALDDSGGAGKKVATALDSMGIYANTSGETLVKLLEHLAKIPDATDRIAAATKVMGRGAIELEPLLKNYASLSDAIDQLGGKIDSDMIAKLAAADDASDKLSIAWGHLKTELAATFSPAVTATLDVLSKLISGTPNNTLEKQLMDVNEQLIQMQSNASKSTIAVTSMMGGGFVSMAGNADAQKKLEYLKEEIESRIEATKRSKEYNEEIAKGNREAEIYAQGAKARAKEFAKEQDDLFRAANEGFKKDAEDINAQQAAWLQLTADLKFFHVELSDPAVDDAKERLARLTVAANNHWIKTKDLTQAQADYNKVFGFDFPTYLENAIKLTDQLDEKFQHFAQSAAHVKDVLRGFESTGFSPSDVLAGLNADVPSDPNRDARKKGTPLGDALLGAGIDRDTDTLKNVKNLDVALQSEAATLEEVNLLWAKAQGDLNRLGTVDLPAVIQRYRDYIAIQEQEGVGIGRLAALHEQELKFIIEEKLQRGESVTAYMIQLEQIRIAEEARRDRLKAMGQLYIDLMGDFKKSFDLAGKAIADNIVDGKNWSDVWHSLVKSIEKMFLETLIGSAFKALGAEIIRVTGLAGTLAKVFGIGGSAASSAASGAAGAAGTAGSAASSAGGITGSAAGTVSSLSNVIGIAGAGIAAASGIVNGIQNARMENLLSGIELSTRATKEQLVGGTQTVLLTWLPHLDQLTGILAAANGMWAALLDLKAGISQNSTFLTELITHGSGSTSAAELATRPAPTTGQDLVANSGRSLSRGFGNLLSNIGPSAPPGFTGSGFPGLGGKTEFAFASGFELDTGGNIGFGDWLAKQNFKNVEPVIAALKDTGVTDTQLFQWLAGFAKGYDFQGVVIGRTGDNRSGLSFGTSVNQGIESTLLKAAYSGGGKAATDFSGISQAYALQQQAISTLQGGGTVDRVALANQGVFLPNAGASTIQAAAPISSSALSAVGAQLQQMQATRQSQDIAGFLAQADFASQKTKLGLQALSQADLSVLQQALSINPSDQAFHDYAINAFADYGTQQARGNRFSSAPFTQADVDRWKQAQSPEALRSAAIKQLNTSLYTSAPRSYSASPIDYGAALSGTSATGNYAFNPQGGNAVNVVQYVYTNDPQVVANKLTDSFWQNGIKTR